MTFTVENLSTGKITTYTNEIPTHVVTEAFGVTSRRLPEILDELGIQRREVKKYPKAMYPTRLIPEASVPSIVGYLKELINPIANQPYYPYLQEVDPQDFHVVRRPSERGPHVSQKAREGSSYRMTRTTNS